MKKILKRSLYGIIITLLLVIIFLTVSTKNAVRANMMAHGVSPISAFKCNPKYAPKTSKSLEIPVYYVPEKFAYKDSATGVHTSTFAIRTYLGVFHIAVTADQYYG